MESTNSSAIADIFVQAAGIPSPWRAASYHIDDVTKTAHLWITRHPLPQAQKKRGWFGLTAPMPPVAAAYPAGPELQWRHLNCMDYTCMIHTADQLDPRHHDLPWLGQTGLPFTNRMSRHVFMCLTEGMEMSALCAILNIPFTELWKFKFGLDSGHVRIDYAPVKKTRQSGSAVAGTQIAAAAEAKSLRAVPDVANPVWEHLISGDLNIQIKTLSFQLILTKLRQQFRLQQSDEVKIMKLRELHRYVERNERSLDHELNQLRDQSQSEPA